MFGLLNNNKIVEASEICLIVGPTSERHLHLQVKYSRA